MTRIASRRGRSHNNARAEAPREPTPIVCTLFDGVRPTPLDVWRGSWAEFISGPFRGLVAASSASKTALPGFVMAEVDGRRLDATTSPLTALAIDVDDCSSAGGIDALLAQAERFRACAYESPSSTDDAPRVRVIVALAEPIPGESAPAARRALAEALGLDPDASGVMGAAAHSQVMFAGRIEGTRERRMWTFDGDIWTPPKAPADVRQSRKRRQVDGAVIARRAIAAPGAFDFDAEPDLSAIADAMPPAGVSCDRHRLVRALGGWLARRGHEPDAIARAVAMLPSSTPTERAAQAKDAASRARAGLEAPGWAELEAWCGAWGNRSTLRDLERANRDPREPEGFDGVWGEWWANYWPRLAARFAPERAGRRALNALPAWCRAHVEACREELRTPLEMNLLLALGALSSAVQGRVTVRMHRGYLEHTGLFVCAVADPSDLKSPAMRKAVAPIQAWEHDKIERGKEALEKARLVREDLEAQKKALEKDRARMWGPDDQNAPEGGTLLSVRMKLAEPPPVEFRYLAEDCTPERLVGLLADHGRIAFITSEGDAVFGVLSGRYAKDGQADVSAWLKAYDGEWVRVDRVSRAAPVPRYEHTTLSAVITTQPSVFSDAIRNPAFAGQGLVQRFCWYVAPPPSGPRWKPGELPTPVPADVEAEYVRGLRHMLDMPETEVSLSPECAAAAVRWRDELEKRTRGSNADLDDIRGWVGKHHGRTARLAAILWAADGGGGPITGEQYERAIAVGRWLLECAAHALRTRRAEVGEALEDRLVSLVRQGHRTAHAIQARLSKPQRKLLHPTLAKLIDSGELLETANGYEVRANDAAA